GEPLRVLDDGPGCAAVGGAEQGARAGHAVLAHEGFGLLQHVLPALAQGRRQRLPLRRRLPGGDDELVHHVHEPDRRARGFREADRLLQAPRGGGAAVDRHENLLVHNPGPVAVRAASSYRSPGDAGAGPFQAAAMAGGSRLASAALAAPKLCSRASSLMASPSAYKNFASSRPMNARNWRRNAVCECASPW